MIAYLCNKCHKPLTEGRYGSGWSADLCSSCADELNSYIGEYYYGGGKYVQKKAED